MLTTITVSPATANIKVNQTQQFTAATLDQNGDPIEAEVTWSTDATAGSIDAEGLFTAGATPEECTVTATSGEVEGEASVTVFKVTANTRASCRIGIGL